MEDDALAEQGGTDAAHEAAALRPLMTADFLATLTLAARTYGWDGDYLEVRDFVMYCHRVGSVAITPEALEPL